MIQYGKQNITEEDIEAVSNALRGELITQGPRNEEFEKLFSEYVGCKYAVAVANGTAALHLSVLALNLKKSDKVITTPITFAASANCVKYVEGEVVFADIDPETYLLDINKVEAILKASPKGTYQGIIPVDFAGRAVNLEPFRKLADEYGLWIIEDACHSPGGYFRDHEQQIQNCGNGAFADLSVFSFHPVKHIACGEGGMITTNDEKLYKKLLELRSHGITRDEDRFENSIAFATGQEVTQNSSYPAWYMEMQTLGFNYRFTDFQAALGISQLSRASEGLMKRQEIAAKYNTAFSSHPGIIRQSGNIEGHAYHLYVIEVEDRLGLYYNLREHKIFAQIHYIPCHLMPYYKQFGWKEGDMPCAEQYYKNCISLPMFPTLTDVEQDYVIDKVLSFLK
ncbi:UDP-4-amino-4,6-dideoxy-N-acetyl-beta-L-altrosamine transaminase [Flavobacterium psychrophilum]|uniref:UDP-4-amino-4, 6-dideoxy-N-acetyl-beta-L-altrosamine transaminase n=1 Tax=Flavobacterium psychrophilum TaxID=96345 RepID=UPI001D081857|nr:UDP-4-amino-4,6-dideoxy-N-acetyl-beta-L-altrosamine transaminase [Flavobacterium psychrophilum]EKT3956838.1 UDP-4-amino-4,6-dideoxy-N-acetyl-beta-L-altrosamine transaminase [Flavobacterium psychrophilum]EKT4508459.1 UDP-4-amino-4,6-dideoxy-N-acetyl-beta-L-altrosamine transaminase [Flavobacterium psychrophilum]MCB6088576.1 UDP-4-amino-4,6-dideoxy-N-acetyl-beta-L-altrosamine transaminase [Flavobacterium psychrophilum]